MIRILYARSVIRFVKDQLTNIYLFLSTNLAIMFITTDIGCNDIFNCVRLPIGVDFCYYPDICLLMVPRLYRFKSSC